MNVQYKYL